jgi:hypothetical protein
MSTVATASDRSRIYIPGTRIWAEWVLVGPDEAKDLLRTQGRNRAIDPKHVARLARDMQSGDWAPGSSILTDEQENMFDAQHRCEAILESGTAQWMLLVGGLPRASQGVRDTGKSRSFGQQLRIDRVPNANGVAASIRSLWFYTGWGRLDGRGLPSPTVPELERLQVDHPTLGEDYTTRTPSGIAGGLYNAFLYLASMGTEPEEVDAFHDKLLTGRFGDAPGEVAIHALRERMKRELEGHSPIGTNIRAVFLVRTWNAFLDGEALTRLQFKPGGSRPDRVPLIAGCPIVPGRGKPLA